MVEIGTVLGRRQGVIDLQDLPEVGVYYIHGSTILQTVILKNQGIRIFQPLPGYNMTDLTMIATAFRRARNNAPYYDYITFMGTEEMWHPGIQVSWGQYRIRDWIIDGTFPLPNGTILKLLKPWYIETYGSWNQTWYDSVVLKNDPFGDTKIKTWCAYYGYTLLKAWNEQVVSLGKQTAFVSLLGFQSTNIRYELPNYYMPGNMLSYFISNIGLVTTGIHPNTLSKIPADIDWLIYLRNELHYQGKIVHMASVCWSGDGWGCPYSEIATKEDMRQALPYIDVIMSHAYANVSEWHVPDAEITNPKYIQQTPLIIQWLSEFQPPSPPPVSHTLTFAVDGAGAISLNGMAPTTTGSFEVSPDQPWSLEAVPDVGNEFVGWVINGANVTGNPQRGTGLPLDADFIAVFQPIPEPAPQPQNAGLEKMFVVVSGSLILRELFGGK